jgi:hypothetical protein
MQSRTLFGAFTPCGSIRVMARFDKLLSDHKYVTPVDAGRRVVLALSFYQNSALYFERVNVHLHRWWLGSGAHFVAACRTLQTRFPTVPIFGFSLPDVFRKRRTLVNLTTSMMNKVQNPRL